MSHRSWATRYGPQPGELEGGHLWYKREKLIEGWSTPPERDKVDDTNRAMLSILHNFPDSERGRVMATIHPTHLGAIINTVLDAVLVLGIPQRLCEMAGEPPHHDHDGRIPCKIASLAESYRVPYV